MTTASPRCQLPHQAPLVERDDEVRTVVSHVCDLSTDGPQVVVVYGPPGAGKSAVALLAAHRAALGFPDGQLYLDLAAGGPDSATAVEAGWGGGWGRERLTGARMLVVVDHCTSATQLRQLLVPEPGCAYVITADSPLAAVDATARIPVGRLSTSAAVTMLAKLTGRSRVAPERLAEALVARCDHLPLAIRAAAAVLIQSPELRLQELLPRLHDGELLNELAVDDLDLRARLLGRYRRLSATDPGTAAWFRRLGHGATDLPPPVARKLMAHGLLEGGRLSHFVRLVATELAVDAYPGRHARDDRGSRPASQGEQDNRVASA